MHYDFTNPDASYYWLHEVLQIRQGELIETYVIECHNDFDTFYDKYRPLIDKIDVEVPLDKMDIQGFSDKISADRKTGILLRYAINALVYGKMKRKQYLPMDNPIIFLKRDYDVRKENIQKIWILKRKPGKWIPVEID